MKKYGILLGILGAAAMMIGCMGQTELGWVNKSSGDIRDIEWYNSSAQLEETWGSEVVEVDLKSSIKEVNETSGYIDCTVYSSGDFMEADIINVGADDAGNSIELSEGSTNVFNVYAIYNGK